MRFFITDLRNIYIFPGTVLQCLAYRFQSVGAQAVSMIQLIGESLPVIVPESQPLGIPVEHQSYGIEVVLSLQVTPGG